MSIGAITGVEFGAGFQAADVTGYEWNDEPYLEDGKVRFKTNRSGGFLGGISTGEDLVIRCAVKPTPTLSIQQKSIDMDKMVEKDLEAITRRDATLCPRMYPVCEAMVRMCIVDALMMARGYDSVCKIENPWRQI
jgi:chorismate synthase